VLACGWGDDRLNKTEAVKGNGTFLDLDANSSGGYCPVQLRRMSRVGSALTPTQKVTSVVIDGFYF
jgi:hypothetical protein